MKISNDRTYDDIASGSVLQQLFDYVPAGRTPLLHTVYTDGSDYGTRENEPVLQQIGNIGIKDRFKHVRLISNLCVPPKPCKKPDGWKDIRATVVQAHLAGMFDRIGMCQEAGGFEMYMAGIDQV
jgi:hypothetical protein